MVEFYRTQIASVQEPVLLIILTFFFLLRGPYNILSKELACVSFKVQVQDLLQVTQNSSLLSTGLWLFVSEF